MAVGEGEIRGSHLPCMLSDVLLESNQLLHDCISLTPEPATLLLCQLVTASTAPAVLILIQLGIQQHTQLLLQHKGLCSSAGSTALHCDASLCKTAHDAKPGGHVRQAC